MIPSKLLWDIGPNSVVVLNIKLFYIIQLFWYLYERISYLDYLIWFIEILKPEYLCICIYRSAEYQNTFSRVIEMNIENLLRFNTFESWFGFLYAKIDMLLFLKCVKVRRSSLKIYFYDKIISWHYLLFKRYRNEWKVTKWFDIFY